MITIGLMTVFDRLATLGVQVYDSEHAPKYKFDLLKEDDEAEIWLRITPDGRVEDTDHRTVTENIYDDGAIEAITAYKPN